MIFIFILSICSTANAQNNKRNKSSQQVKIDKNKPSVYIVSETDIKRKKLAEADGQVLLRLHNNTRWGIWLNMSGGSDYEDASLYYEVFNKGVLEQSHLCHVCSVNVLPSGKSLSFSIPKEELAERFSIRIQFDYDWGEDWFESEDTLYFVQFFSSDLKPKD